MRHRKLMSALLLFVLLLGGCVTPSPTPTPTPVPPTVTHAPTLPPPTNTPVPTTTPLPPTNTPVPTATPLPPTNTPVPTATSLPPTNTPVPTATPLPPTSTPLPPMPIAFDDATQPWNLIASYVNAINRHEYARAYAYWETPPQPYDQFVAGFADTAHVELVLRPPTYVEGAAGSMYSAVPTMLLATHTDGSLHYFVGCYTVRRPNPQMVGHPTYWKIYSAEMHTTGSTDGWQLTGECSGHPIDAAPYDDHSDPVAALASYVNAIVLKDYGRAYGYWETPPSSYQDFVNGFADTKSVVLLVRLPVFTEGAAGSFYTSIPTMLMATHTDGSRHNFVGCYVMRTPNPSMAGSPEHWMIYSASMAPSPGNSSDVRLIGACR